jgi:hypothetical protein
VDNAPNVGLTYLKLNRLLRGDSACIALLPTPPASSTNQCGSNARWCRSGALNVWCVHCAPSLAQDGGPFGTLPAPSLPPAPFRPQAPTANSQRVLKIKRTSARHQMPSSPVETGVHRIRTLVLSLSSCQRSRHQLPSPDSHLASTLG